MCISRLSSLSNTFWTVNTILGNYLISDLFDWRWRHSYSLKAASGFQGWVGKRTAPGSPCFILWCCLSPLSEEFVYLQCSQENREPAATEESTVEGACLFLLRNSILRLAFLLCVLRGFPSFLAQVQLPARARALLLVSKEKEKVVPMFREKWKVLPWVASAWQNSMHLE